ncbi:hypothetical protein SB781_31360, partial [Paraburkholderia sp. SIMBA_061]
PGDLFVALKGDHFDAHDFLADVAARNVSAVLVTRMPENFNVPALRVTGDTDITVSTMLLKVSSIDGNTKLDALDIDSSQGIVNASGTAQLSDNWPVDITLNSTLNVEPLKGEKVKLKVGGALREQLEIGVNLSGPVDMDLRAQTRLAEAGLPLNVEVNSKQIYWPFTGEKQ